LAMRLGFGGEPVVVKVRVMLVDDQLPVLRALAAVVAEMDSFEVVGQCVSGEEGVATANSVMPDLVLMDVNLPGIDGLEATRRILRDHPATVVVLLSTYDEEVGASFVAESGAAAYITKAAFEPDRLAEAWSGS
jgi:DNA-binding NarL/FixJ family response regulator